MPKIDLTKDRLNCLNCGELVPKNIWVAIMLFNEKNHKIETANFCSVGCLVNYWDIAVAETMGFLNGNNTISKQ